MTSFQINHILFPTDFSETAKKALPLALDIAKRSGAKLTLLHTLEEPYDFAPLAENVKKSIRRDIESLFQEQLDEIRKDDHYNDIEINTTIKNGHPVYIILEEAGVTNADLIIMGLTGASGIEKMFVGSTTNKIITKSDTPVLAVPRNYEHDRLNGLAHITFLTDYNDSDLEILQSTVNFAELFDAEITVLHIENELSLKTKIMNQGFKEIASHQISYKSLEFELFIHKDFNTGISDYLDTQWSSMLVMTRYKKSFFVNLFSKDHARELNFYNKLPLFVFPVNE